MSNRILFVRNLPHAATRDELFDLFGQFGPIRQIRLGTEGKARGTCYVVYEELDDAKKAVAKLSGFLFHGFYITVGFFNPNVILKELSEQRREKTTAQLEERIKKQLKQ
ncbi:hypothetical protein RCL1_005242 [Eukaryota sp. TZLM3-RCL]